MALSVSRPNANAISATTNQRETRRLFALADARTPSPSASAGAVRIAATTAPATRGARGCGGADGKQENRPVDRHLVGAGQILHGHRDNRRRQRHREQDATVAPAIATSNPSTKNCAANSASAQGHARRGFTRGRRRASAGGRRVGTGDQEQQPGGPEQQQERGPNVLGNGLTQIPTAAVNWRCVEGAASAISPRPGANRPRRRERHPWLPARIHEILAPSPTSSGSHTSGRLVGPTSLTGKRKAGGHDAATV